MLWCRPHNCFILSIFCYNIFLWIKAFPVIVFVLLCVCSNYFSAIVILIIPITHFNLKLSSKFKKHTTVVNLRQVLALTLLGARNKINYLFLYFVLKTA